MEKAAERQRERTREYTLEMATKRKAKRVALRQEVLEHYGNKCVCCNETEPMFLNIDHINGGGTAHRRQLHIDSIYKWLKRNSYPDGFQILCANCNGAKGHYSECPHTLVDIRKWTPENNPLGVLVER